MATTLKSTRGGQVIDYTTWRKGRKTAQDGIIGVCPKCGRKGAMRHQTMNGHGFIFVAHGVEVAGFRFIDDHCFIKDTTNGND